MMVVEALYPVYLLSGEKEGRKEGESEAGELESWRIEGLEGGRVVLGF